jgi:hypothetical protein
MNLTCQHGRKCSELHKLPGFGVTVRRFSEHVRAQANSAMLQTVLGSNTVADFSLFFFLDFICHLTI